MYEVINGDPRHSDHRPIIVKLHGTDERVSNGTSCPSFKFEARWLQEDKCDELVQKAWL